MASETEPHISVEVAARLLGASEVEIKKLAKRGVLPSIKKDKMPLAATVQRYVEHVRLGLMTINDSAALIGKTNAWVHQLIAAGYIARHPEGGVRAKDVYEGYIKFLTDEERRQTKVAAESRVRDARAKEIELRVAVKQKELMPVDDLLAVMSQQVAMSRAEIAGLPARVTRDVELRRAIEREVDGYLSRMAERNERAITALQAGGDLMEASAEVNA
jgi:hypothetical protein